MADVLLNKDPGTYEKERDGFIRDLKHFHETRGTPIRKYPHINGKEIDLYLLYTLVTSRGGWIKVNQRNEWSTVLTNFSTPNSCVNGDVALKQIYLRYLDRYEKIHFLGETGDRVEDDEEDSRHKKSWTARAMHSVPLLYNYHQHSVPDNLRSFHGLSTDLYKSSDYDKLALSLISPLPNEQDFAINVCALLSGATSANTNNTTGAGGGGAVSANDGKCTSAFRLCDHPRLIHYLLGHAAVFNDYALRRLMEENYKEVRGYSMKYFWSDVLEDKELAILTDEKKFVKRRLKREREKRLLALRKFTAKIVESSSESSSDNDADILPMCSPTYEGGLKVEPEDLDLFCLGRSYGTQDKFGQRVLQIAMIFRNATFIEENVTRLAGDLTFLRFVLLCCGSRWNCIHQLGFDMLTNLSNEIVLVDSLVEHLIRIICTGLESEDRAVILASIEALNKLSQKEENEDIILRHVHQKAYKRICSFLTLHDIMILIQTLECLYSLSSLGERACNNIVHVHGAISTLVALVTVEAQSYGPKACILMRVVETITGGEMFETDSVPVSGPTSVSSAASSLSVTSSATQAANSSILSASGLNGVPALVTSCIPNTNQTVVSVSSLLHAAPLPTPAVASPVPVPAQQSKTATTISNIKTPVSQRANIPAVSVVSTSSSSQSLPVSSSSVIVAVTNSSSVIRNNNVASGVQINAETMQQDNESFAVQWLRTIFEAHPTPGRGIEQGELYKQYLNACTRAGRKGCIAPSQFPQCVKSVFGNNVGPRQVIASKVGSESTASKIYVYEGIQVRPKSSQFTASSSTNNLSAQQTRAPSSPILKAQLSNPTPSTVTKKEIKSKVSTTHPHLSNVLMGTGNIASSLSPSSALTGKQSTQTSAIGTQKTAPPNVVVVSSVGGTLMSSTIVSVSSGNTISQDTIMISNNNENNNGSNSTNSNSNNNNSSSLIKSLLASKVGSILGTTKTNPKSDINNCLQTPHQIVINKTTSPVPVQVTQRQQQQQLQQPVQIQQPSQLQQIIQQPQQTSQLQQLMQQNQTPQPTQLQQLVQQQSQVVQVNQQPQQRKPVDQETPSQQQHVIQIVSSVQPNQTQSSILHSNQQLAQDIEKILPQVCQQLVAAQKLSDGSKPQIIISDQVRQLLQGQQKSPSQISQLLTPQSGQSQSVIQQGSQPRQQQQVIQQPLQRTQIQGVQNKPTESCQGVSVITSTASVQVGGGVVGVGSNTTNLKPFLSRINGMKNFPSVNFILTENKNGEPEIKQIIGSAGTNSAGQQLVLAADVNSGNGGGNISFLNNDDKLLITNALNSIDGNLNNNPSVGNVPSSNRILKVGDFEIDDSSQSLPVITIKDPLGDDNTSNTIYEDYLINGIANSIKTEGSLGDLSNNIMTEETLLNNIMMEDALASNIIGDDALINTLTTTSTTDYSNPIKSEILSSDMIKQNCIDNSFTGTNKMNFSGVLGDANENKVFQNVIVKNEPNFTTGGGGAAGKIVKMEENSSSVPPTKSSSSNMLAELLEKTGQKKEAPMLNGALRFGEKGLEFVTTTLKDEAKPIEQKSVIFTTGTNKKVQHFNMKCGKNSNNGFTGNIKSEEKVFVGFKRTNDQEVQCDDVPKRICLNGDSNLSTSTEEELIDESNVKASSSAANLYAALAADVLGDIEGLEDEESLQNTQSQKSQTVLQSQPQPVQTPVIVSTQTSLIRTQSPLPAVQSQPQQQSIVHDQGTQQFYLTSAGTGNSGRQIFALSAPHGAFSSMMGSGNQQLLVSPQTAIIQGQPQTVLVTQTTQQPGGTPTKTIIILNPPPNAATRLSPAVSFQQQQQITNNTQKIQTVSQQVIVPTSLSGTTNVRHTFPSKQNSNSTNNTQTQNTQFVQTIQQQTSSASGSQISGGFTQQPHPNVQSQAVVSTSQIVNAAGRGAQSTNSQQQNLISLSTQNSNSSSSSTATTESHVILTASDPSGSKQSSNGSSTSLTPQSRQVRVIKSTQLHNRIQPQRTLPENQGQYLCEWRSCMRSFKTANEVYLHACAAHCPNGSQEIQCLWERCDAMKRKRFSLMTHLYDRHCNPEILRMMAVRRRQISQCGRSEIPPPLPPAPHPGYAPNAAYQAIRRHALEFVNPKELQDENEGPVTKSIRLTSSLILRNLVIYSTNGSRVLKSYEPHLASIASSNVESSGTVSQMIFEMNNHDR